MDFLQIDWKETIGQVFSIIAFTVAFFAYQAKNNKKLLLIQTVATACFCISYLLLGEMPGCALNAVAIVRNIIFYHNDKKIFSSKIWPYGLAAVMVVLGALTWDGWYSILFIVGLAVNTVCMALPTAQGIRKSLLVTCPPVLIYNICVFSVGGIINEILSIISAVIGIIRHRKDNKKEEQKL